MTDAWNLLPSISVFRLALGGHTRSPMLPTMIVFNCGVPDAGTDNGENFRKRV